MSVESLCRTTHDACFQVSGAVCVTVHGAARPRSPPAAPSSAIPRLRPRHHRRPFPVCAAAVSASSGGGQPWPQPAGGPPRGRTARTHRAPLLASEAGAQRAPGATRRGPGWPGPGTPAPRRPSRSCPCSRRGRRARACCVRVDRLYCTLWKPERAHAACLVECCMRRPPAL